MARYKCCWCGLWYESYAGHGHSNRTEFNLKFLDSFESQSDGVGGWGFETSQMCRECGQKLYGKLIELGISFDEIDY